MRTLFDWVLIGRTLLVALLSAALVVAAPYQQPRLDEVVVAGTVVDPEGNIIKDAKVACIYEDRIRRDAEVRATTTNDSGCFEFTFESPVRSGITVVAWKEGYMIEAASPSRTLMSGDRIVVPRLELPITLGVAAPAKVRVVDHLGNAITSAKVHLFAIDAPASRRFYLLQPIADFLTRTVNADGVINLDFLPESWGVHVCIETNDHALQRVIFSREELKRADTLELLPISKVQIEISAPAMKDKTGHAIALESNPNRPPNDQDKLGPQLRAYGVTNRTAVDQNGMATLWATPGKATVVFWPRKDCVLFAPDNTQFEVKPDVENEFKIELMEGIRLTGRILTFDDEPVANAAISVRESRATSDQEGRFEFWVPQKGRAWGRVLDVPAGYCYPMEIGFEWSKRKPDGSFTGEIETNPVIRIEKSREVSGRVIDDRGNSVPLTAVVACWTQKDPVHGTTTIAYDSARAGTDGKYVLNHVLADTDVLLWAGTEDLATNREIKFYLDETKSIDLLVDSKGMVQLNGRVIDKDGKAIPSATILIKEAYISPDGHNFGHSWVEWNGLRELSTDGDGRFESPRPIRRQGKYSAAISAPGYFTFETPIQSPPPDAEAFDLGELSLERARSITGNVQDVSGNPLPGAEITAPGIPDPARRTSSFVRAVTDAKGQFELINLHPSAAMGMASLQGYQAQSIQLIKETENHSVVLLKNDETIPHELRKQIRASEGDRLAAGRRIVDAIMSNSKASRRFQQEGLSMLARIDKESALQALTSVTQPETRAAIFCQVGEIEDALSETNSIENSSVRARLRMELVDKVADQKQAYEILANIRADAALTRDPKNAIWIIVSVARRLTNFGKKQDAEVLLREALDDVNALGNDEQSAYTKGQFAEQWAVYDPVDAFRIINEIEDPQARFRHLRNAAHTLADKNPEMAVTALTSISGSLASNADQVCVAYNMAGVDLPRALQLVDAIDDTRKPGQKAFGLTAIAWAIGQSEGVQARELLKRAAELTKPGSNEFQADRAFGTAMLITMLAEELDPENLTYYYSKAIQVSPGPSGESWTPDGKAEKDLNRQALLALFLSLYEGNDVIVGQITQPIFEYWEAQIGNEELEPADSKAAMIAMALSDPDRASKWVIRFQDQVSVEKARRIPQPIEIIGNALTLTRKELRDYIAENVFYFWVPNRYDF